MGDHVYKIIEVVGSSSESSDKAIKNAIAKTAKTVHHLDWFQVVETRGHIIGSKVGHYQVVLKIGFRLDE